MSCWVSVREGRESRRSGSEDESGWGEELMAFDSDEPVSVGAKVLLPDGCIAPIVGLTEQQLTDHTTYIAVVGDAHPART